MDVRRRAAHLVLVRGHSIAGAARECGLSRPTVRLWVARARVRGFGALGEESRRPRSFRSATPADVEQEIVSAKARFPAWGAKKLWTHLWKGEAPVCVRTVDRILDRHGLTRSSLAKELPRRFERESPNALWQMDFKGLGIPRMPYSPLSVLDDASRFCIAFEPVAWPHTAEGVWAVLWSLLGEFGQPEAVLTDNEGCFASPKGNGPSLLESRLWRLGIRTLQGRPAHPQTQGKVERFHRTAQEELGELLRQPTVDAARQVYEGFVSTYNWVRPHEALDMRVPGELYRPSTRARPQRLPEPVVLGKARKVDASGKFWFGGHPHRAGRGLMNQWVDVRDDGLAYYAGIALGSLDELRV